MDQPNEPAKESRGIAAKVLLLLFLGGALFGLISFSTRNRMANASDVATTTITKRQVNGTKVRVNSDRSAPTNNVRESTISTNTTVRDRLVISMKTMPSRIKHIQPTLDSLLFQQTYQADQFYLALPQQPSGSPQYVVPDFVHNYSKQGFLTILRPDYDLGALDKMIHTLGVEHTLFQQQSTRQAHQFRILYLDDDMIYDPKHVEILVHKSDQYPHDVVALSGCRLRSHFRQIGHSNPQKDRHPFLYFWLGGLDSHGDRTVDIVQGFMGVLVRLSFFNVPEFLRLSGNRSVPDGVRREDDFIICGYLESRNVTRRCVDGGLKPVSNPTPSTIGNLGRTMHRNAMTAASYLQREWGIWSQYQFEPYLELSQRIRDLIDCESRKSQNCPADVKDSKGRPVMANVTRLLDREFNVSDVGGK